MHAQHHPELQRATEEETLEAILEHISQLELKQQGSPDSAARKMFSSDDLDYYAASLKLYGDLGWGMEYALIREMFLVAIEKDQRIDPVTGELYHIGITYVREFINSRPELMALKASHIDPLRSKKATAEVR